MKTFSDSPYEHKDAMTHACPYLLQVNNATARVMTNKKTVNPYANGKFIFHPKTTKCKFLY